MARAKLPPQALSVLVVDAQGLAPPRLRHQAEVARNPASVMKLVTTFAALDQLGAAFTWRTPVYLDGRVQGGTLHGNLYVQGRGDPTLVLERLWLLLRQVQGLGIRQITGDIVLDRSAFEAAAHDPASFDGEPSKPYNAAADALLLNFKSLVLSFTPVPADGVALLRIEPPLAGLQWPSTLPLQAGGDCGDWRGALQADLANPARLQFAGAYPVACGARSWPLAYADPASYAARAVAGMWREVGGTLGGQVRDGQVPSGLTQALQASSPALAEVVRDINKYSNNVMAQQLFLTLSLQQQGLGSADGSRQLLQQWWRERIERADQAVPPQFDNGSGLSRDTRISADALARMLQVAWASPLMPELLASLPISGVDGTLKKLQGQVARSGSAHLKTGSLRDVNAVAGYVDAEGGQRYVLVAMVNHANAAAARPVLEALVDWTAQQR